MSRPHSSPQVISFLESLKEEYPEEFKSQTLAELKRQELKDIDVELAQLEKIQAEQIIAPRAKDDEWIVEGYSPSSNEEE